MLGFGVIVGSTIGAGVAGVLRPAEILLLGAPHGQTGVSAAFNSGGGSAGAGGAGGGPRTIIETITHGGGGGGSGGGGSAPAAPTTTGPAAPPPTSTAGIPPIKHVFLIMLSDQGYYQTFASNDPYFGGTLPKQGEVVPFYYGVTQGELANQIALLSGQGPTPQTASNCPKFAPFSTTGTGQYKELLGSGCVYPSSMATLPGQLASGKHGGWKAYIQGLGTAHAAAAAGTSTTETATTGISTTGTSTTATATTGASTTATSTTGTSTTGTPTTSLPPPCGHPALGASDPYASSSGSSPYVTWRNPFVYFQSTTRSRTCPKLDVSLSVLAHDLKSQKTTPALSYISPDPCDDGSDQPCTSGAPAGLRPAAKFVQTVVAEIERSPAYKAGGLIMITFDEAPQSGPNVDSSSCCNQPAYPNIPPAPATGTTTTETTTTTSTSGTTTSTTGTGATGTGTTTTGTGTTTTNTGTTPTPTSTGSPGGGQVGLLLISKYVKPGTQDALDYFNHFSLLASLENLFKLPKLGYAKAPGLAVFTPTLFNAGTGS